MPNMSYCRFENTYRDLKDCSSAIADDEKLSKNEAEFAGRLVELCRDSGRDSTLLHRDEIPIRGHRRMSQR